MSSEQPAPRTPATPPSAEAPTLAFALEAHVDVALPYEVGHTPRGQRRIVPITGGTFAGPGLNGEGISGTVLTGADWQIVHSGTLLELEASYALQTDDGAIIDVVNGGYRYAEAETIAALNRGEQVDPATVYFRTTARMSSADPKYAWLSHHIFLGVGQRHPRGVIITFYRVL